MIVILCAIRLSSTFRRYLWHLIDEINFVGYLAGEVELFFQITRLSPESSYQEHISIPDDYRGTIDKPIEFRSPRLLSVAIPTYMIFLSSSASWASRQVL
jgi:hypothetical protein